MGFNSQNGDIKNDDIGINSTEGEQLKGVHMGDSPYLWRENNPDPYRDADTPSERFVPTSAMYTGEDNKIKRILKYVMIGLIVLFVICAFVMIWRGTPQTLYRGDTGRGHFFK